MEGATQFETVGIYSVLVVAIAALIYAWLLRTNVLKASRGSERIQKVARPIREGAVTYLNQQFRTIIWIVGILAVLLFLSAYLAELAPAARELGFTRLQIALGRAGAFLAGSFFSIAVGRFGMLMAVEGSLRVAAASAEGKMAPLQIAYRAGTITGMLTDGLGLFGGTLIFIIFTKAAPEVLLGFGFGGTLIALFMRVGGGIYTKAADVGADLVGKVEHNIPEDDPRNAAVIADLVGDNVGDCAGMAADIFESYEVTIVSTMILGLALMSADPSGGSHLRWIVFPLLVRAIGVVSSIIGTYAVSWWPRQLTHGDAFKAMDLSYDLSSVISTISFFLLAQFYVHDLRVFAATAAGILLAVGFNKFTSYFTHPNMTPVRQIAKNSRTGSATLILQGLAIGFESAVWATLIIAATIVLSLFIYTVALPDSLRNVIIGLGAALAVGGGFAIFRKTREPDLGVFGALGIIVVTLIIASFKLAEPWAGVNYTWLQTTFVLYSVSLAGIGMLSHTGNNVAMDAFGPIADNANGIGEMAGLSPRQRQVMADLDAVGNTTKAITKGIAIASAVIAAVSLFGSFITDTATIQKELVAQGLLAAEQVISGIDVAKPLVFVGLLIGGTLPFLFSSLAIRAVTRAAVLVVQEVRRQFRLPGLMEGRVAPDYTRAVAICTKAAQKELLNLAILVIAVPVLIGFALKVEVLGGFLAGIIVSGQLLAVFMATAGGAWDNAKKIIEDGLYGGKRSEAHKASVVGDTIGDPLKDTAGPALNPMIKVVNLVSLLLAPLIVRYSGFSWPLAIAVVLLLGLLVWVISNSKREITMFEEDLE